MEFDISSLPRRKVLCIDMKSFFASVECVKRRLDPLKAHLIVIGKKEQKGSVVLAATPAVKRDFGIRTGSRKYEIPYDRRIIMVEPNMSLYLHVNHLIQEIYRRYVAEEDLHIYSIDESFLDVTASQHLFASSTYELAKRIQNDILSELRLIATVGIGDNPLLAKVALDIESKHTKDGIAYWRYEDVPNTLWKIKQMTDMWGIGSRTVKNLHKLGIFSIYDLAHSDVNKLKKWMGVIGEQLYYHAWGVDFSRISERVPIREKSYGKSQIFLRDYTDAHDIEIIISEMMDDVAARLRSHHAVCGVVHLTVGYSQHEWEKGFSHQMKLDTPTNLTQQLTNACLHIFRKHYDGKPVRSVAIAAKKIAPKLDMQLDLFTDPTVLEKQESLDFAIDSIRNKYGKTAILHASSYTPGGTALYRSKLLGGHKA